MFSGVLQTERLREGGVRLRVEGGEEKRRKRSIKERVVMEEEIEGENCRMRGWIDKGKSKWVEGKME